MGGELFRDVNVALTTSYRLATLPAIDAGATRRALVTVACLAPSRSCCPARATHEVKTPLEKRNGNACSPIGSSA
jgi:hypothetical protein